MDDVSVAPTTRDLASLSTQVAHCLCKHMPEAEDLRIIHLVYPIGAGRSHETLLIDAGWTCEGKLHSRGFALRIKPSIFRVFPDDLFEAQYRVMSTLHEDGRVRVARPLWFDEDSLFFGAPYFVMEKLQGRVPVSSPPYSEKGWVAEATPRQRTKLWENGIRQLAAIQTVPRDKLHFLEGSEGAREGLQQEWGKYCRFVEWISEHRRWPVLEAGLRHLRDNWPGNQPPGLVWGDARLGNMMFDSDFDVLAVMDWEQPSLGGALHDLGWWLVMSDRFHGPAPGRPQLAGLGTRQETIALWHELTGISTTDIEWYEAFARLKLACTAVRMAALKGWAMPTEEWLSRRLSANC